MVNDVLRFDRNSDIFTQLQAIINNVLLPNVKTLRNWYLKIPVFSHMTRFLLCISFVAACIAAGALAFSFGGVMESFNLDTIYNSAAVLAMNIIVGTIAGLLVGFVGGLILLNLASYLSDLWKTYTHSLSRIQQANDPTGEVNNDTIQFIRDTATRVVPEELMWVLNTLLSKPMPKSFLTFFDMFEIPKETQARAKILRANVINATITLAELIDFLQDLSDDFAQSPITKKRDFQYTISHGRFLSPLQQPQAQPAMQLGEQNPQDQEQDDLHQPLLPRGPGA